MIAQSGSFQNHGAGLRAQNGEAAVNDDALIGGQTNNGAGLDDDFVGHTNCVRTRQRLGA